jgi:hypothetical protein
MTAPIRVPLERLVPDRRLVRSNQAAAKASGLHSEPPLGGRPAGRPRNLEDFRARGAATKTIATGYATIGGVAGPLRFCRDARLRPAILGIALGLAVIEMQRHEFIGLLDGDVASPFALAARKDGLGEEPCARSVLFCSVSQ